MEYDIQRTNSVPKSGLSFVEYGARDGWPVLFCHGLPGSHVEARAFDSAGHTLGVRVIAPDRPGYGNSPFTKGRRLADWPAAVTNLADRLGLEQFGILGVSGGGPYALCCAHELSERVTNVVVVSGIAPLPKTGALEGLTDGQLPQRRGLLQLRKVPFLAGVVGWRMARQSRRPGGGLAALRDGMSGVDQDRIDSSPDLAAAIDADARAAFRQGGRGFAWDLRILFTRPWGFSLGSVTVPVQVWHGADDNNVPGSDAHQLAASLPHCQATFVPNEGHLLFIDRAESILREFVPRSGRDGEPTRTAD